MHRVSRVREMLKEMHPDCEVFVLGGNKVEDRIITRVISKEMYKGVRDIQKMNDFIWDEMWFEYDRL